MSKKIDRPANSSMLAAIASGSNRPALGRDGLAASTRNNGKEPGLERAITAMEGFAGEDFDVNLLQDFFCSQTVAAAATKSPAEALGMKGFKLSRCLIHSDSECHSPAGCEYRARK